MVMAILQKDARTIRKEDRRAAILNLAAASFLKRGYAGTSMSAIAAEMGGSKGTLWSYFPSKEALFDAVLDNETIAYRQNLGDVLDPCGDLRATLTRFCESLLEKVTSPEALALHRLAQSETQRFPEVGRIFFERAPMRTYELLGRYLERCMEDGRMRRADPERLARRITALCLSGVHQGLMLGLPERTTPEELAHDIEDTVDIIMRAYAL